MSNLNRRHFLTLATGAITAGVVGYSLFKPNNRPKILIIGGGAGGLIAAKYLRQADKTLDITLIEQNTHYYTCFMSNEVLSGARTIDSIKFSYDHLAQYGIKRVHDKAIRIDPTAKQVHLQSSEMLAYDRLVVSPGISFQWNAIKGYNQQASNEIPHAWQAGPQTLKLQQQLKAMKNGGTVIITVPAKPFRCPPGPYERASQIAQYLKQYKPRSKILIFDANQNFPKQALFMEGWEQLYGYGTQNSLIEWIPENQGGQVVAVDPKNKVVYSGEFEEKHQADVLNIIPPQKAGLCALKSALTDKTGWCPINQKTFESTLHKDIYIIGDACLAGMMPKSAYSANSQAKVCAHAIIASLRGVEMVRPSLVNTCYSVVGEDFAISVAAVYRLQDNKIEVSQNASGVSPLNASATYRKNEFDYAHSWYNNITHEMFN
jgi:sulfide dehydrogenase [flavocytochrome c] flavoprotein chain